MRVLPLLAPWMLVLAACDGPGKDDTGDTDRGADTDDTDTDDTDTDDTDDTDTDDTDTGGPPDTESPSITLTSPRDGQAVAGTVSLEATASDDRAVTGVTFTVDGAAVATDEAEPWERTWDSTGVINGNYRVGATATDAAGNAAAVEANVVVDNGGTPASAVRVINPVDGASLCGAVTVEVAVSGDTEEVAFSLDGTTMEVDTASPFTWDWSTLGTTNGSHAVRATATLEDGSVVQNTIVVTVENTGEACDNLPNITITAPTDGAYGFGTVSVTANASDDVGVLRVQFFVDSGLLVEDASIPYGVDWDSDAFDEGPHILKAIAYDTADQSAETRATITIDRSAPLVEITEPGGGTLDGMVTVSADVTDAIGLDTVVLQIDGSSEVVLTEPPFAWEWDTTLAGHGSHTIEVIATDRAGHVGVDMLEVDVDNPPEVTVTDPGDGDTVSGTLNVRASAVDDDTVSSVSLFVDGTRVATDGSPPYVLDWDSCDASGAHTLEVQATDSGGNSATDSISVIVDQALEVQLLNPAGALDGTEVLAAYAAEDSTITQLVWDVDGVVVATLTATSPETFDEAGVNVYGACSLGCPDDCDYYEGALDGRSLAEGSYTLTVTATNAAGDTATDSAPVTVDHDQDGDGYDGAAYGGDDCADDDRRIHPGATETCDGADDDCDGVTDDGFDMDGDGSFSQSDCPASIGDDCDDGDARVHAGAAEACDGVDNDCDGLTDVSGAESWSDYTFGSGSSVDDFGGAFEGNAYSVQTTTTLDGFDAYIDPYGSTTIYWRVYEATSRTGTYTPVATYTSTESGSVGWYDSPTLDLELLAGRYYILGVGSASSDTEYGWGYYSSYAPAGGITPLGWDADSSPYPATLSGGPSSTSSKLFRQRLTLGGAALEDRDIDADGMSPYCGDCDDDDASSYDGAPEACDSVDNDCDGAMPDEQDDDSDGYMVCEDDCDDTDDTVHPSAAEACDGVDDDCDGALGATEVDVDGDGVLVCDEGIGADCDDTDPAVSPYGTETCDGVDDDCDGVIDDVPTGSAYYADTDRDGYGDAATSHLLCGATPGWVADATDCDDTTTAVSPSVAESCNAVDDDCDGTVDEGPDADGDGYSVCEDCDDGNAGANPAEAESCGNSVDEDCDGLVSFCQASGSFDLSAASVLYRSETSYDNLGYAADVGDFNGDGNADVLLGAPHSEEFLSQVGAAYVLDGADFASRRLGARDVKLVGDTSYDWVGWDVAAVPDMDGDGDDEALVGVYGDDQGGTAAGAAYLVAGPIPADLDLETQSVKLIGENTGDGAGMAIAAADLDGDGLGDFVIGAASGDAGGSGAGTVYFVSGPLTANLDLSRADALLTGESASDVAGSDVDASGDVDGDGIRDLLIAAPGDHGGGYGAGAVYLVLGPPVSTSLRYADLQILGESANDGVENVAIAGDTDGDGYDDIHVGATRADYGGLDAGATWLVRGPRTGTLSLAAADAKFVGEDVEDYAGQLGPAGDVDGDGFADLLVGAYYADDGGSAAGVVYLQYGPVSGTMDLSRADVRIVGENVSDMVGGFAMLGSDLDGDGLSDLVIGSPTFGVSAGGTVGGTYLLFGEDLVP
jgi:hypothetical protein